MQDDKEYTPEEDVQEQEEEEEEEDDPHIESEDIVFKVEELKTSNGKTKSKKSKANAKVESIQEQVCMEKYIEYVHILSSKFEKF